MYGIFARVQPKADITFLMEMRVKLAIVPSFSFAELAALSGNASGFFFGVRLKGQELL